jgi:hypothetical protein
VDDPTLVTTMGAASRSYAEKYYDVREVNRQMLETMGLTSSSSTPCVV